MPVTLSQYALTTLESAKRACGITTAASDDLITELINGATALIENTCNRKLASRTHANVRVSGMGVRWIVLPNTPVTSVTYLARVDGTQEVEIQNSEYYVHGETGIVYLRPSGATAPFGGQAFARDYMRYVISYVGGYSPIPDDLIVLCNELVAEAYRRLSGDPRRIGETLGDYSYTLSSVMPEDRLARRLVNYRRVSAMIGGGVVP